MDLTLGEERISTFRDAVLHVSELAHANTKQANSRARSRRYRERHREQVRAKDRAYQRKQRETHAAELNAKNRAYREANKEALRKRRAAQRATRREALRLKAIAYRAANREAIRARKAMQYLDKAVKVRAAVRAYRAAHLTERRSACNAWQAANPEKMREYHNKRRAHKLHAPVNDFTAAQWREMQDHYDHRCVYCDKRAKGHLTQDHITPLSQGGSHTYSNILPACKFCNSKKGRGNVLQPVQPLLLTVAQSKSKKICA